MIPTRRFSVITGKCRKCPAFSLSSASRTVSVGLKVSGSRVITSSNVVFAGPKPAATTLNTGDNDLAFTCLNECRAARLCGDGNISSRGNAPLIR